MLELPSPRSPSPIFRRSVFPPVELCPSLCGLGRDVDAGGCGGRGGDNYSKIPLQGSL